jgi:hypothetical protein
MFADNGPASFRFLHCNDIRSISIREDQHPTVPRNYGYFRIDADPHSTSLTRSSDTSPAGGTNHPLRTRFGRRLSDLKRTLGGAGSNTGPCPIAAIRVSRSVRHRLLEDALAGFGRGGASLAGMLWHCDVRTGGAAQRSLPACSFSSPRSPPCEQTHSSGWTTSPGWINQRRRVRARGGQDRIET